MRPSSFRNVVARPLFAGLFIALALSAALPARADDAAIRKAIAERIPDFPKIDEIRKTPIPGVYELRLGTDLFYADETGSYLIQGQLIETKSRVNLTEERIQKLTAIDFKSLPLKDAVVWKQGTGERKMVVFADPNCGYCKKLERDLQSVKDVTVYTFLYPILGPDSTEKSKAIWCAKDKTASWRDWMINAVPVGDNAAGCDAAAVQRNVALGRRYKVTGTPAIVFEDGTRKPGALPAEMIERQLAASRTK